MLLVNSMYRLNTLAPNVLGAVITGVVESRMSYDEAIRYRDLNTLHDTLLNVIVGLNKDIRSCTFVKIKDPLSGDVVIIAEEYIDPYGVVLLNNLSVTIHINPITNTELDSVKIALAELGIRNADYILT